MEEFIREDLISLYNDDIILKAVELNNEIGETPTFCANMQPMFFTGDIKAKTVFVMLNPGGEDFDYSFKRNEKNKYSNFEEYLELYIDYHKNFGEIDYDKLGKFDLKQAAFLYYFQNSGVEIPDNFWKDYDKKKIAKRNVLMQKLQLELIPYHSKSFSKLFDTKKNALNNFHLIKHNIDRLFKIITLNKRKYVLFGSKQFYYIFLAINKLENSGIKIELGEIFKEKIGNNFLSMNNIIVHYNNESFNGKIIHSFASQALPNAFVKMSDYGKFCYENNSL